LLELIYPKPVALNILEIHIPPIFAFWLLTTAGRAAELLDSLLSLIFASAKEEKERGDAKKDLYAVDRIQKLTSSMESTK